MRDHPRLAEPREVINQEPTTRVFKESLARTVYTQTVIPLGQNVMRVNTSTVLPK